MSEQPPDIETPPPAELELESPAQRERLGQWFLGQGQGLDYTTYCFALVEKAFSDNGLVLRRPEQWERKFIAVWSNFTWHLHKEICYFVTDPARQPLARRIFAELVAFCRLAPASAHAQAYLDLVSEFDLFWQDRAAFMALLPPEVADEKAAMDKLIEARHLAAAEREEELYRLGQMGY